MYRVAIVGGETHIGEITALQGTALQITGVAVHAEQQDWARGAFSAPVVTDWRALLDEGQADIVAIANENDGKAEVALAALERGLHLIVDKPLALTLADTLAIQRLAEKRGRRVLMLLTLRGDPWYRKARELVAAGAIGLPMQVYGKMSVELKREQRPPWFLDKRRAGGPILDLAIHTIDQVEWVTGLRLTDVTAQEANLSDLSREELIDCGAMFYRLSNGGTAMVEQNRVLPPGTGSDYRLDVVGTLGQVNLRYGKSVTLLTAAGEQRWLEGDLAPSRSVVADWLASLAGGSAEPLVPDAASFRANVIACLAKEAADSGKTVAIPA